MPVFFFVFIASLASLSQQGFADQEQIRSYSDSKRIFWQELYNGPGESLYCKQKFEKRYGLNIEHVYAASWMKNGGSCSKMNRKECRRFSPRFNRMEADLHNLYPTKNRLNSSRSNFPFTIIKGSHSTECDLEVSGQEVEPPMHSRGKIARSILYMEYEYSLDIDHDTNSPGQKDILLSWHCVFPPDQSEISRNKKILQLQGNNNPYIDGSIKIDCDSVFDYPED